VLNQFGASVGQSLGSHLVIGSTVKLVSGGAASQVQAGATGSLDAADGLDPSREVHAGLDVGAMAAFGRARIGVMVRNVNEVDFGSGGRCVHPAPPRARRGGTELGNPRRDRQRHGCGGCGSDDHHDGDRRGAARRRRG